MKRIVALIAMILLWTTLAFAAPQWEYVGDERNIKLYVDINSVKTVTVDYNKFAKGTTKSVKEDGGWTLMTVLINKDTKEWCSVVFETYNAEGKVTFGFTNNPKNPKVWNTPSDSKTFTEILRLAD